MNSMLPFARRPLAEATRDGLERRALAGARRTEEGNDALGDAERHDLQHRDHDL